MVPFSQSDIEAELNKLEKSDLIGIILNKKLPTMTSSVVLGNFISGLCHCPAVRVDSQAVATLLPVTLWLNNFKDLKQVISFAKSCSKAIEPCIHGIVQTCCYLCSLKGAVILFGFSSMAVLYHNYPDQLKEYARKSWNATGSLYRTTTRYIGEYSVILAKYSVKLAKNQGPNVWYYGVLMPYSTAKAGLYYSGVGLKKLATTIGYYSGNPEEPQTCTCDKCNMRQ